MATAEQRRLDLYNAFIETFGAQNADTMMEFLAAHHEGELATRSDIVRLEARMDGLEARMDGLEARMDHFEARMDRFEAALAAVNGRLDRLFLTLLVGLIGMIAAVLAQGIL